ncbi:hypothetical protein RhiirA4_462560 [Rhizophagus irregularis]|uniref:Transmembrane protein n=1 Tax=Rhizophagus irregularis TaxID=588596 RepID=A0A2I1GL71_9GLOM|nr:hypothetical protein RhiirA4_462560 [Rhizophagus irregularis]
MQRFTITDSTLSLLLRTPVPFKNVRKSSLRPLFFTSFFRSICLIVMHVFVVAVIDGGILYHSKMLVYSELVLSKISMTNAYIFVGKMPRQCNKHHKNAREAPYVVYSHRMVLYLLFFSSSFLGLSSLFEITKSEGDNLAVYGC